MAGGGSNPGERRGGRQAGTPNKVTRELAALAREHTEDALACLVSVLDDPEAPAAARISAAHEILDRGHGKAKQAAKNTYTVDLTKLTTPQLEALRALFLARQATQMNLIGNGPMIEGEVLK